MPRKKAPEDRIVLTIEVVGPASEVAAAITNANLIMKSSAPNCVVRSTSLLGVVTAAPAPKPRASKPKSEAVEGPRDAG